MNYFKTSITVEQIKQTYRELARLYHPDLGGDLESMKLLNAQYLEALKACDNRKTFTTDNKEYTYKFDADLEQSLIDKIHEFLGKDFKGPLNAVKVSCSGDSKSFGIIMPCRFED